MHLRPRLTTLSILAVVLATTTPGLAQSFEWLGDLPGGDHYSIAMGVTGSFRPFVVGFSGSASGREAFRWSADEGMIGLGDIPGGDFHSMADAVSADGSVVIGVGRYGGPSEQMAFRWTADSGMVALPYPSIPDFEPELSVAWDLSADGLLAVGRVQGFLDNDFVILATTWLGTSSGGLLGGFGGDYSSAHGISPNGTVIVGGANAAGGIAEACRWINGSIEGLGGPGEAKACSDDGDAIVGWTNGLRWTPATGWQDTGLHQCFDISGDGSIVVGVHDNNAKIWRDGIGMHYLRDVLQNEYGLDMTGITLKSANAISSNGRAIVGWGTQGGQSEAFLAILEHDTDEDGLLDSWETEGIDVNNDGIVDLDLPAMGADPGHKDLFVEVDMMSGVTFQELARDAVEVAFAGAPVPNPDQTEGINLHILVDETNLNPAYDWPTNNYWPVSFDGYKAARFGTAAERDHPDAAILLEMKKKFFRYCIATYTLDVDVGGIAELPGNDFIVCIGRAAFNDGYQDDDEKAAVFMHELGHTLNLRHGGIDDINGKPNYVSIMNYALSYPMSWSQDFWTLDYSQEELLPLDETDLDETVGIDSLGLYDQYWMPFGVNIPDGSGGTERSIRYVRLDGRGTDFGDTTGTGFQDGIWTSSVVQDLNFLAPSAQIGGTNQPSPGQEMPSHDDWANIVLPMPDPPTGDYADGMHVTQPHDEPTLEAVAWINDNFPDPPPDCASDVNGDGTVDVQDLLALLAAWNSTSGPEDINGDGVVDVLDLLMLLAAWGPC